MNIDKKAQISIYKKNKTSYSLLLLAVLFEMVYTIVILNNMTTNYKMGAVILVNIVIIFLMFSCSVKLNVYDKKSIYLSGMVAVYAFIRLLFIVPMYVRPTGQMMVIRVSNILICVLAALGTLIARHVTTRREQALKQKS